MGSPLFPKQSSVIQHHDRNPRFQDWLPLEAVDAYGQSPLHLASLRGNAEVVQYILEEAQNRHAALHSKKNTATSSRISLTSRQENDLVRHLLTMPDKEGKSPLDLAIKKEKP